MTQLYAGPAVAIPTSTITEQLFWKREPRKDTSKMRKLDLDTLPTTTLMRTLGYALSLKRQHGGITEAMFVGWLANRLPVSLIDGAGNLHVDLREDPDHRTMFTAHTDSVHSKEGSNTVRVDGRFWRANEGSALGADDGAGIALMCHMIEAGVPGYYVFFRGEECGGLGSSWLAENMPELFLEIDRAIAFDRAGYSDVITHQSGGRCCSDTFASALSVALSTEDDWYIPDDTGVYTDTAEFTHLVSECTNISVGYAHQHGDLEQLDVEFFMRLAQQVIQVAWDALPTERDHTKREKSRYSGYTPGFAISEPFDFEYGATTGSIKTKAAPSLNDLDDFDDSLNNALDEQDIYELAAALEYARDGSPNDLLDLIAFNASPDDPNSVRKLLSSGRLDHDTCEGFLDLLTEAFSADEVLEELLQFTQIG